MALAGCPPDRVPRGEFKLAPPLVAALAGRKPGDVPQEGPERWQVEEAAIRCLGADMVGVVAGELGSHAGCAASGECAPDADFAAVPGVPWLREVAYWSSRDLFVWALVDGPWQGLAGALGWSQAIMLLAGATAGDHHTGRGDPSAGACGADRWAGPGGEFPVEVEGLLFLQLDRVLAQVGQALEAGADGIVLGEDVAYTDGLLLSPRLIREHLWPLWREVVDRCGAVRTLRGERPLLVFHSDGRVEPLIPVIREAGFDGLHSLEPEAGMDAAALVTAYRGRLGLLGGLSVDLLSRGTREEVEREAVRLARAAREGGLVVGCSSGLLPEGVSAANLLAAYRALDVPL